MKDMNNFPIKNIKYAVQVVILNSEGYVLSVSRKNDHTDMGLVGGKVDPEDSNLINAIIRETKEETGLTINKENLTQIFSMFKDGYMGYTYFCDVFEGDIETDEPHVVKWVKFKEVCEGTFGEWNEKVKESLDNLKIKYKK